MIAIISKKMKLAQIGHPKQTNPHV